MKVTGASGGTNQTTLTYDMAGRKIGMSDPDMGVWSYAYDAAGNLTQQTDARGVITTLSHDALNRLLGKTYSGTTPPGGATPVTFQYDQQTIDGPACARTQSDIGHATKMADVGVDTAYYC